jgi:hypothetical protein
LQPNEEGECSCPCPHTMPSQIGERLWSMILSMVKIIIIVC